MRVQEEKADQSNAMCIHKEIIVEMWGKFLEGMGLRNDVNHDMKTFFRLHLT